MKNESIGKYHQGFNFCEGINRQHGTRPKCQQALGIKALSSKVVEENLTLEIVVANDYKINNRM
jgi:hypothetical protein